ncbi:MAG: protein-L-isoaspartate(D-aspartate) O-methyltransferase [Enhygromyxa sp.]
MLFGALLACGPRATPSTEAVADDTSEPSSAAAPTPTSTPSEVEAPSDPYAAKRKQLVDRSLRRRDISDPRVLAAIEAVPRHRFVPDELREHAYLDRPLPIGHEVTISQPYIVALMTQLADVQPGERVLEVGTGSGYQAAVLAELGAEVYTIERIEALAARSEAVLAELGYAKVHVRYGDGYAGWPERAPFDAIILTAAPPTIPSALTDQLAVGGKLVAPVGAELGFQELVVVERTRKGLRTRQVLDVAFVPMIEGTTPD